MTRNLLFAVCLKSVYSAVCAQSIPDSELNARLKANQSHVSEWDYGSSLKHEANQRGKDVSRDEAVLVDPGICSSCPKPDPNDNPQLKILTSRSDIVVVGHDVRNISALTRNEAFVFTDSEFIVDQVWKNATGLKAGPQLSQGSEITIVEPGGHVQVNGHKIEASISNRVPLTVGHKYLMYLKYATDSRSYIPVSVGGFDISSLNVVPLLTSEDYPLLSDEPAFIQAVHSSTMQALAETK